MTFFKENSTVQQKERHKALSTGTLSVQYCSFCIFQHRKLTQMWWNYLKLCSIKVKHCIQPVLQLWNFKWQVWLAYGEWSQPQSWCNSPPSSSSSSSSHPDNLFYWLNPPHHYCHRHGHYLRSQSAGVLTFQPAAVTHNRPIW